MAINRRAIFQNAHFSARVHHINTNKTRPYSYWFQSALKHEWAKVRQAKQMQAERNERPADATHTNIVPMTSKHQFRLGTSRAISAVGA
jgi:hypothetical protein